MLNKFLCTLYTVAAIFALGYGQYLNQQGLINAAHFMGWANAIAMFLTFIVLTICILVPGVLESIVKKVEPKNRAYSYLCLLLDTVFLGLCVWFGWIVLSFFLFVNLAGGIFIRKLIYSKKKEDSVITEKSDKALNL